MRKVFANSAILISVHGDQTLRQLITESSPSTLSLDQICRKGTAVGVMMTTEQLSNATESHGLVPQLFEIAQSMKPRGAPADICLQTSEPDEVLSKRVVNSGLCFVQAKTLSEANRVAEHLLSGMQDCKRGTNLQAIKVDATNVKAFAPDIVGIIITGAENWSEFLPDPSKQVLEDKLPTPTPSYKSAMMPADALKLSGVVVWCGDGLIRRDDREFLAQRTVPPGEGFLRIDQIIAEALAKTGFLPKFGA